MSISQNFPEIAPSLNLDFARVKALDPRVTFARASSATYYGTETAKAKENLLLRSQEFNTGGWGKGNTTVTANTENAPDGTTTAETITATVGTAVHSFAQGFTSIAAVHTFSVFAKAGTLDYIQLRFAAAVGGAFVNFDITSGAGAIGTSGGSGSPSGTITDVGNGWFRCSITATITAGAATPAIILVTSESAVSAESWTALGTETVFFWGAQLEQRSAVTAYTPTTDQPITRYQPVLETATDNVARFDHDPITFESLGLLVEEQRTNLLTYSEDFSDSDWRETNSSIIADTIVAPDGTLTGYKHVPNSGSTIGAGASQTRVYQNPSVTSGTAYTFTVYAKAGEYDELAMAFITSPSVSAIFSLTLGTVVSGTGATITPVGNGWYRCALTATATSTGALQVRLSSKSSTVSTGDGYSGIYIWGAQLEAGAFPTSYIKTVASQVTRAADAASMTGANFSSWYRQDEGSFYSEVLFGASAAVQGETSVLNVLQDNSTDNQVRINRNVISGVFRLRYRANASDVVSVGVASAMPLNKVAAAYSNGSQGIAANGTLGDTASGTGPIPTVNNIVFGLFTSNNPNTILNGHIRKLSFYPKRLTNAQLQALTKD